MTVRAQPRDATNPQESREGKATLPGWVTNASSKKKTTEPGPEVKNPAVTSEQHVAGFGREAGCSSLAKCQSGCQAELLERTQ